MGGIRGPSRTTRHWFANEQGAKEHLYHDARPCRVNSCWPRHSFAPCPAAVPCHPHLSASVSPFLPATCRLAVSVAVGGGRVQGSGVQALGVLVLSPGLVPRTRRCGRDRPGGRGSGPVVLPRLPQASGAALCALVSVGSRQHQPVSALLRGSFPALRTSVPANPSSRAPGCRPV